MAEVSTALVTGGAAVLSACIALGGVYIGQLLQGRREREQRAELWRREDQHRFAEHKRELYARCLALLTKWIDEIDELCLIADIDVNQIIDNGGVRPDNLVEWIKDDGRKDPIRYIDRCAELRQQVRLVAPSGVYEGVGEVLLFRSSRERALGPQREGERSVRQDK